MGDAHHATGPEACANCGTVRLGPYCHVCGQAGHVHRNLMALVHDISHGVFHFEGKVWHTLPLLTWRPGELTRRYVQGERARFVSPIALFLFSVFLMFAVLSNLGGHGGHATIGAAAAQAQARTELANLQAARAHAADKAKQAELDGKIAETKSALNALQIVQISGIDPPKTSGNAARAQALQNLNVDTGWPWLNHALQQAASNPDLLFYKMKTYAYKFSWALIPISLPFIWLLFAFRRDVGLYDHAIFAIYSLSFMSLLVVALSLFDWMGFPGGLLALAGLLVPPVHMCRQLKGAYCLSWFGAVWRTVALLISTFLTSSLFGLFLFYMGTE